MSHNLDYPVDIQSSGVPYIVITASEYATVNMVVEGTPNPEVATYHLVIPQSIQSSDNLSYDTASLLNAQALTDLTSIFSSLMNVFINEVVPDSVKNNISGGLGKATNPKEELLFKSPDLRTHTFTFNMFVKNKQEGDAIVNIIKSLRKLAYPELITDTGGAVGDFFAGGGNIFLYPHQFSVEMHPNNNNAFPYIPGAFLTSITTNYAGSGRVSLTPDDHFQAIELTLTFQDIRISTASGKFGINGP